MRAGTLESMIWRGELKLRHRFTTARNSSDIKHNVFIRIEHDGIAGYGEAAPNIRYNETPESAMRSLQALVSGLRDDPLSYRSIIDQASRVMEGNQAALAALDMALLDWLGKRAGLPLYLLWGLKGRKSPITTMTIGIDDPKEMQKRALEAKHFKALKVKLGTDHDRETIESLREVTAQPIRVDANEGWHDREFALKQIKWLADKNVQFIEQPMPAAQKDDMVWLKQHSPLPLIADEAVTSPDSILALRDEYHGINIKLMKCGGILAAIKAITLARAVGLRVMLGCMIESSLAIAAAAQLSPLVDYADLDGNLLIDNDPFIGHPVEDGRIVLNTKPGLGAELANWQDHAPETAS